jgi:hexosaminidase
MMFSATYPNINSVPFDMTQDSLYPVLRDVTMETASMFSDDYMHIGGDEVIFGCLDEVPAIKEWMAAHNMNTTDPKYSDLLRYFRYNVSSYVTEAKKNMVVWQEAFEQMYGQPNNPLLPSNTGSSASSAARPLFNGAFA